MYRNGTRLFHFSRGRIVRVILALLSIIAIITLFGSVLSGAHPAAHANAPVFEKLPRHRPSPGALPLAVMATSGRQNRAAMVLIAARKREPSPALIARTLFCYKTIKSQPGIALLFFLP